jgi:hypothetical protein
VLFEENNSEHGAAENTAKAYAACRLDPIAVVGVKKYSFPLTG